MIKNILLLFTLLLLAGCAAVPVQSSFPDAPEALMRPCEKLDTIPADEVKFSAFLKVVTKNYKKAHNCSDEVAAWQEWYQDQKKIFEEAQKKSTTLIK